MAHGRVTGLSAATVEVIHGRVTAVSASASWTPGHGRVTGITASANWAVPVEPLSTVTLPAGTWTQTSGNTVVVTDGAFVAPATISGTTVAFTDGSKTASYQVLPHTLWINYGGSLAPLKV